MPRSRLQLHRLAPLPTPSGPSTLGTARGSIIISLDLAQLLFPPLCLHCAEPLHTARPGCCPRCLAAIQWLPPERCRRCGLPRPGRPERCARCRSWPEGLACRAAVRYAGAAESVVRHLKYQGWLHLAHLCAQSMAGSIEPGELDALVPVPLHAVRRRARGYNQARVLADALGGRTGLPVIEALARSRATRPQVGLGRSARAANVAGAFVCRMTLPGRVGLVDDVTTSGATMVEAAGALLASGARSVVGLVFALAPEGASG